MLDAIIKNQGTRRVQIAKFDSRSFSHQEEIPSSYHNGKITN